MDPANLYGSVFDAVHDPLVVVDETGHVHAANAAAMRCFDLDAGVGESMRASNARFSLDVRAVVALVRRGERVAGIPVPDRAGRDTGIVADVEPIPDSPRHCLLHFRAGAENLSRELWTDDVVASVAHELRNPLAAMQSALDAFASGTGTMDDTQRRFIDTVRRGAARLTRIVDGYLDLTRVRAGVLPIERAEADVRALVVEITHDLGTLRPDLRDRMDVEIAHDVRDAYVDRDRMTQVLLNLVCNATRFTPGDRRITVRATRAGREALDDDLRLLPWEVLGDSRWVRFDVEDQGIGMSPDTLAHLFERYHAGEKESCDPGAGAHLGLHISRMLAEAHDGWMKVESRLGEGTVVSVFVPEDEHTALLVSRVRLAATAVRRLRAARRPVTLAMIGVPAALGRDAAVEWERVALVNPSRETPAPDRASLWLLREHVALAVVPGVCDEDDLARRFDGAAPLDARDRSAHECALGACVIDDGSTFLQALRLATSRMVQKTDAARDGASDTALAVGVGIAGATGSDNVSKEKSWKS